MSFYEKIIIILSTVNVCACGTNINCQGIIQMNTLLTIIVAVIGFGILVFFHEGVHCIVAKLFGVKVETFAIGWGPKLIGFTKGGTSYQISVFPIGGFCKFKGDEAIDESDESVRDPDSFYGTASWKRLLIAFAGPFMNFLIAVIMFSFLSMCSTDMQKPDSRILLIDDVQAKYGEVTEHSPAFEGGLQSGDKIIAINGEIGQSALRMLVYSFFCGIMVFLAVDIFKKSKSWLFKVGGLVICVALFVITGMEHCIADMFYFAFSNVYATNFLAALLAIVIATAGNSLGAIATYLTVKAVNK